VAAQEGELISHPRHDLRGGVNIGGRDVDLQAQDAPHLPDIGPAQALQLARRHFLRVANDAALPAAKRDVHDGRLPGHPGRQGPDGVDGLVGVVADAALRRPARVVVLDAEALEDLRRAVVHLDGQRHVQFAQRLAQQSVHGRLEVQYLGCCIELGLCDCKGIKLLFRHVS
jgi:hypothetical protein